MRSYRVAAVAVLLGCGPTLVHAQGWSLGAGGMYAALNGSDFNGVNAGWGGDVQFRYHAARGLSIGGGVQYTSHGADGLSENFGVRAFFADARYAFERPSSPSVRPYLGARVALAHYGVSSGGSDFAANGTAFGPVGGLLIGMTPGAQLDFGIAWFSVNFGDAKLNGTTQSGSDLHGSALALRAGAVFAFGKN